MTIPHLHMGELKADWHTFRYGSLTGLVKCTIRISGHPWIYRHGKGPLLAMRIRECMSCGQIDLDRRTSPSWLEGWFKGEEEWPLVNDDAVT